MSGYGPPTWARRLAELLVRGPEREFVLGDLEELHAAWVGTRGRTRATLFYLLWSFRTAGREIVLHAGAGLRGDARLALRQLRRTPRVHVGGALVLAVGLGLAVFLWGIRYGALGRDMPVSEPDRVVGIRLIDLHSGDDLFELSVADVRAILEAGPPLETLGLWSTSTLNLSDGEGPPERAWAETVSPAVMGILELEPLHGRLLLSSDARPDSRRVAVLGHGFWTRRHGADPAAVGRTLLIDGRPTTVVGVLPPGSGFTGHEDVWLPIRPGEDPDEQAVRDYHLLGRLLPGATVEGLTAAIAPLPGRLAQSGRDEWRGVALAAADFHTAVYGEGHHRARVLRAAALLLFVMVLSNVGNLFLVHTHRRARELVVRRALGAGLPRLLRQLTLEALVPGLLGFLGAAGIAAWCLAWYEKASDAYGVGFAWQVYRLETPHLVLLAAASFAATVLVSALAVFRIRSEGPSSPAGDLRPRGGRGGPTLRLGRTLLGVETAVGGALLLVGLLMLRSGWNLRTMDLGFETASVMTADIALRGPRYDDPEARRAFWRNLREGLASLGGVESIGVGTQLPMIRCCGSRHAVELEGWEAHDPAQLPTQYVTAVEPGYFETFEAPVLAGRGFTAGDAAAAEPVALVNEPFVRRFLPGASPLGRRIRVWRDGEPGPWRRIVGVAPHLWMDTDVNARPGGLYLPLAQDSAPRTASLALRVSRFPDDYAPLIRSEVARLDPALPVDAVRSMPRLIRDRTRLYRRDGPVFAAVGLAAFGLALAGLWAIVSYMASLRTAELGIRAALGAGRSELARRSVAPAVLPTAAGGVIGLALGLSLTRGMDRYLFLVDPTSPGMAAGALAVLALSALAAALGPALRASRVDVVSVLEAE